LPARDPRVARLARQAFQNYGRMLADFLLLGSLSPTELLSRVKLDGLERIDAALAGGRGVVVAMPHTGSWDMAGAAASALGYPVHAVAERFPGSLDEAIVRNRQIFGLKVIPLDHTATRSIRSALNANQIVALVCDLPHGRGVEVEFLGGRMLIPSGPAAFALKHRCPLLTAFAVRTVDGTYQVRVDPELDLAGGDQRGIMQSVADRFQGYIRADPGQWYAFMSIFR